MLTPVRVLNARMIAGFFLLSHIVGFLFFPVDLTSLSTVYTAFVVAALSIFCFLPRVLLRWVRGLVLVMAVAALFITLVMVYGDITLVNGADYGALVLRAGLVGILIIMLMEAWPQGSKK